MVTRRRSARRIAITSSKRPLGIELLEEPARKRCLLEAAVDVIQ